jgi:hypothetical protein
MAIPLIALGAFLSPQSYSLRRENERELRVSAAAVSALPQLLLYGIAVCALRAVELAVVHFTL